MGNRSPDGADGPESLSDYPPDAQAFGAARRENVPKGRHYLEVFGSLKPITTVLISVMERASS
jgi:hypothetical protein